MRATLASVSFSSRLMTLTPCAERPVWRSLSDLARRIDTGDHDMTLEHRVIATLEDIEQA